MGELTQTMMRRRDTTRGPPLRILSLDGGGVRGYSILIILQELMHRTFVETEGRAPRRDEIPRPCDHFDLIAGTGTGGLIAIMLGRLRLDLDTCKDLYVRMTRRVFETDKTLAGIPWKSTMFKASKLEMAIREAVRLHTVSESEGNDSLARMSSPVSVPEPRDSLSDLKSVSSGSGDPSSPRLSFGQESRHSQIGNSPPSSRSTWGPYTGGNADASLYDARPERTKTAVTAVMRGTPTTKLLRSYDSRREPAPEVNCSIWQAGRATCATAMAFKPIQIGQTGYLDEGGGKYNPAPLILDEALQNEWPGREVGVFVSIGTGKRPTSTTSQQAWWENYLSGSMGEFVEAKKRLIAKLEGCEETHQYMMNEYLAARGVDPARYYRLNVEVGVGEFGMNEWARLSEISTNTRLHLSRQDVEATTQGAAARLAHAYHLAAAAAVRHPAASPHWPHHPPPPLSWHPALRVPSHAAELPADAPQPHQHPQHHHPPIGSTAYFIASPPDPAASPYPYPRPAAEDAYPSPRPSHEYNPTYSSARPSHDLASPPPLPPKNPDRGPGPLPFANMDDLRARLPYPDVDGPPPPVNPATKPAAAV